MLHHQGQQPILLAGQPPPDAAREFVQALSLSGNFEFCYHKPVVLLNFVPGGRLANWQIDVGAKCQRVTNGHR